jgi:dTDP-4-amino-4,6-dideoxygalactose transaminase
MDKQREITVTSPLLPPLGELIPYLEQIWDSKWVTNNGRFHNKLESAFCSYFGIEYLSLFTNSTIQLIMALKILDKKGEVITTPFSFIATANSILWSGLRPVFVDVDPVVGNIEINKIEEAITPDTVAIMPVHLYGYPCDTLKIDEIASKYGIKVIYDAAHMFGVKVHDRTVLDAGDMNSLSFHATKVFNTLEGGALISKTLEQKEKIDRLNNHGFLNDTQIVGPGINSKMDEVRAALGLLNLQYVDKAIEARRIVALRYREELNGIPGIRYLDDMPGVKHNYCYFPVFIDRYKYGISRDGLYEILIKNGIKVRRYFYPLLSNIRPYDRFPSSSDKNLPIANRLADSVICLPIHHELKEEDILQVVSHIKNRS